MAVVQVKHLEMTFFLCALFLRSVFSLVCKLWFLTSVYTETEFWDLNTPSVYIAPCKVATLFFWISAPADSQVTRGICVSAQISKSTAT